MQKRMDELAFKEDDKIHNSVANWKKAQQKNCSII